MENNDVLSQSICEGNKEQVISAIKEKIKENVNPLKILNEIMIPAMKEVGGRYSRNEIFLPEMLYSAKAMQNGIKILEPLLIKQGYKSRGKLAIGTVQGDLHDIGKNIVVVMLKGAGYEVLDLGIDCSLEKYVTAIKNGAQVILCSALLTTTMPRMKEVVDYCKKNYPDIKIVVGGAPVSESFAEEINADAYGENASCASEIIDGFFKIGM
jgi:5-methyltetrahydrofolate--homocysteine methyltransferase